MLIDYHVYPGYSVDAGPHAFALGSIHCLERVTISSRKECHLYFPGKEVTQVCKDYYSLLNEAVKTGLFDCIAIPDLYPNYRGIKFP